MHCPKCNELVEGGKFCEHCGAPLAVGEVPGAGEPVQPAQMAQPPYTAQASQTAQVAPPAQPNQQLEAAKKISKLYFGYFLSVLKKPYTVATKVGNEQFVNGLITVILYALIIPLMLYMSLGDYRGWMDSPVLNIIVKPTIGYTLFLLLIATYIFIAIKLGKVNTSYKDVIARFGTFLVPFVTIFALAFIAAILQIEFLMLLLLVFGFVGSIYLVPPFVISSFKGNNPNGLDTVYGTLMVYVLIFITTVIMGRILFSVILDMLDNVVGSSFFW